jgi:alpha-ketoglutaric semialdehyde dehydrogenase
VVVMAHYAHPGTSELVGRAIRDAVADCGLMEGVFSLLFGNDHRVGGALVTHPQVRAVAFTGSRTGGEALRKLIAARPAPIPFYAEMSSINPMFMLPGAMRSRAETLAHGLHASVTLGVGQFCTNPGVVFIPDDDAGAVFVQALTTAMSATPEATMLTPGICAAYRQGVNMRRDHERIETLVCQTHDAGAALFRTDVASYLEEAALADELFGPSTLVVTFDREEQLIEVTEALPGQLTATLHGDDEDLARNGKLIAGLTAKAGRVIFNGFPTGVEVCPAMVHGGPYPATSDGQSTSVGTGAILRFSRPVCYQDAPAACLPSALRDPNPDGLWRTVDGALTRDPVPIR